MRSLRWPPPLDILVLFLTAGSDGEGKAFPAGNGESGQELSAWQKMTASLELLLVLISRSQRARSYYGLMHQLEEISSAAADAPADSADDDFLDDLINQFNDLTKGLKSTPNCLRDTITSTHALLQGILEKRLARELKQIGWPAAVLMEKVPQTRWRSFARTFKECLQLAKPAASPPGPLNAIRVLVDSIAVSIRYHFSQGKPTNRLDKPEWFLQYILKQIKDHQAFVTEEVQALMEQHFESHGHVDAMTEFIYNLLQITAAKLRKNLRRVTSDPELISHTVTEIMRFDLVLAETYSYSPQTLLFEPKTRTLMDIVVDDPPVFTAWLNAEDIAARGRFAELMRDRAWDLVSDNDPSMRPTRSAELFVDLMTVVTEHFRPLPPRCQLEFFNNVLLGLLEEYLDAAREHVNALLGTYIPGVDAFDERVERIGGLCRGVCGVGYVCGVVVEWGEDVLFLALWRMVEERLGGTEREAGGEVNGLFRDVLEAYRGVMEQVRESVVEAGMQEFTKACWEYDKKRTWASIEMTGPQNSVSSEFLEPVRVLKRVVETMTANLPSREARKLCRELADQVEGYIMRKIVLRWQFSVPGAVQFERDVEMGLVGTMKICGYPLKQACKILLDEKVFASILKRGTALESKHLAELELNM
ncbi:hypothetical protein HK101_009351, partial [Irineochytrium annulatum]